MAATGAVGKSMGARPASAKPVDKQVGSHTGVVHGDRRGGQL